MCTPAANPGEAVVQVTTLQVTDDLLPETRSPEAAALPESLLVALLKGLEVALNTLVVRGEMRLSRPVDRVSFGQFSDFSYDLYVLQSRSKPSRYREDISCLTTLAKSV